MTRTDTANIREVYAIASRLEEKIDRIDRKVANMEGRISIISIIWSSVISLVGISVGIVLKHK